MKKKIIFFILCLTVAAVFAQRKETNLQVKSGGELNINLMFGDISIETWGKNEFSISYEQDLKIRIEKIGNIINVAATSGEDGNISIKIPVDFSLDISTLGGNIFLENETHGKVNLKTSGGDVRTASIQGPLIISSGGGNVSVGKVIGKVEMISGGGDMSFGTIDGSLKLSTAGGNISGGSVNGAGIINTSGGDIGIGDLNGIAEVISAGGNIAIGKCSEKLLAKTGGGDVYVGAIMKDGIVTSGSGNIGIGNLVGSLKAKTSSGEIEIGISSDYKGNSEIMTGSGNARLNINENANVKITSKIAGKNILESEIADYVTSDFTGPAQVKSTPLFLEATYDINKAENKIELKINNGQIFLKKIK